MAHPVAPNRVRQMAWRGIASLVILLAWVVFIVVFAIYWAPSYNLFQNVVVLIGTLIGAGILIGILWMAYGMRHGFDGFGD